MKANHPASRALAHRLAVAVLFLPGACAVPTAPPPAPPPAPIPRPVAVLPPPLPAPPADWRDAAQTPGDWRWALVDGRSRAGFSQPGAGELAALTCDRSAEQVLLARAGGGADSSEGHVAMAVTTTTGTRPLLSEPLLSPPGWLVVPLKAGDPILDAIAFSRGRFALEAQGLPTLTLPAWPELSRVIEDCR